MTKIRISITKEVLEATKDCDCSLILLVKNCAISYAVREIWPEATVGSHLIKSPPFRIPHHQEKFIQRFDYATPAERAAMQPFSFEIEVPDEVTREVNIEEIRRICETSKTLEVV